MGHYAKIIDGKVAQVIVADSEEIAQSISPGVWVQTSYNTHGGEHIHGGVPLRKNFAGIGMIYDKDRDAFIPPRLYPSWILDESSCLWKAPVDKPTDSPLYDWDEENLKWVPMPKVEV